MLLVLNQKGEYQRSADITVFQIFVKDIGAKNWEKLETQVIILKSVNSITDEMFANIINNKDFDINKEFTDLIIKGWESKAFNEQSKVINKHFELFIDIIY